jgi:hypothetical protein
MPSSQCGRNRPWHKRVLSRAMPANVAALNIHAPDAFVVGAALSRSVAADIRRARLGEAP